MFGVLFRWGIGPVFLFGVEPADPLIFTTVAALLVAVCISAAYLPSRRILRLDPMTVLKTE